MPASCNDGMRKYIGMTCFSHLIIYMGIGVWMGAGMTACDRQESPPPGAWSHSTTVVTNDAYDLPQIQESGELIALCLSGPDTYYAYRGQEFGLQYALASAFARQAGVRLRMETARDTAELLRRLNEAEADLIALELPADCVPDTTAFLFCGAYTDSLPEGVCTERRRWVVRRDAPRLAEALDAWFRPELRSALAAAARRRPTGSNGVRRHARSPIQSAQKGIISPYDALFVRHAGIIGWDWRLLAAQCYQESGFDPQAVSWAGACGLMQLMPATAEHLGLPVARLYEPADNIAAAARYLRELTAAFADVTDGSERINFVLAAYNGGAGHVRDAMTLARAAGKEEQCWTDVEPFVRLLALPQYYNRPEVKFGYLRGEETVQYVGAIRRRWNEYRRTVRGATGGSVPAPAKRSLKNGTYESPVVRPSYKMPTESAPPNDRLDGTRR